MEHFIKELDIVNFKSIKHLKLDDFRRINLFIGRPNVGKSNILEALSLFCLPYFEEIKLKNINDLIRLERPNQLLFNGLKNDNNVIIATRNSNIKDNCHFSFDGTGGGVNFELFFENLDADHFTRNYKDISYLFDEELNFFMSSRVNQRVPDSYLSVDSIPISHFKKYIFRNNPFNGKSRNRPFLLPPFGANIEYVIELHPELKETFEKWFNMYGLRLVLDSGSNSIRIMKDLGNVVFSLPYSSIADTLQRIIFYKTAIVSNKNSVLIFEEPEAHAYPPYIAEFTQEVIHSDSNQFIMATHSPIIVNDFLENAREDLAIFMVDFKDGQTVARPLSREEIEEVYVKGVDLFFNNEAYTA